MVKRLSNYPKNNSFFLFGARGTGKTTWLKELFKGENTLWLDLLRPSDEEAYLLDPGLLEKQINQLHQEGKAPEWVVIDEIQKCPKLLDIVHLLIESKNIKFALTGSSSRRLKQKGTNLLAGRAFVRNMFPLTHIELGEYFNLQKVLSFGSLPKLFSYSETSDCIDYLSAYANTYIKNEIQEEQWVRKIEPFRKFLPIAAQMNGQPLNYFNIAKDVGVDSSTIKSYYEILEDTLLGFQLNAYHLSVRQQQRSASKFYFFDTGIKRQLERKLTVELSVGTTEYGRAFEHLVILEFFRLNEYYKKEFEFSYLLTKDGLEIDLIIERPGKSTCFIEIKSKDKVDERDCRHLERLVTTVKDAEFFILSNDPTKQRIKNTSALPWQDGIKIILG